MIVMGDVQKHNVGTKNCMSVYQIFLNEQKYNKIFLTSLK